MSVQGEISIGERERESTETQREKYSTKKCRGLKDHGIHSVPQFYFPCLINTREYAVSMHTAPAQGEVREREKGTYSNPIC